MFRCILAFTAGALAPGALPSLWSGAALGAILVLAVLSSGRKPATAAALAGFAWAQVFAAQELAAAWPCERDREVVEVEARIGEPSLEREGRTDLDLEVIRSSAPGPAPRRIRVAWYDADRVPGAGELWRFTVSLRCPRGFANPGAQDRELALLRDGIDATGYVTGDSKPERLAQPRRHPVERLRERIARAIADAVPQGPSVAVLQGLSVGVRGQIPDTLWDAFAVTGTAHLMAISGLHVTGCAVAVLALLRLAFRVPAFSRLRGRVCIEAVVVTAVTAGYAALSGASVPALRTLAAVTLVALLRVLRRTLGLGVTLGLTALVLVASDPLAANSAGFWLSFVATAALIAVASTGTYQHGRIVEFTRAQVAITVLLAPILAASFGRLSLVAPLANAVAIPAFGILLLPAVLLGTVLAAVSPAASGILWRALASLLDGAWPVLESIAEWRFAAWSPAAQPLGASIAAVGCALAALLLPVPGLRLAAVAMVAGVTIGGAAPFPAGAFRLTAVDVGQGLAVVVETAGHVLVFDTGPKWRGGGAAAPLSLVPLLRARGIRRVDRLVASHDDADHAGGVESLARSLPVARVMAAPGSRIASADTCVSGDAWSWDRVVFVVVHPPAEFAGSDNDRSCAILVSGPGGSALLLADPESAAEESIAAAGVAADLILLPHHGSRTSSSAALVAAVNARVGIASAGFGNRWGMPDSEVVARWRAAGATVLNTATEGAITVRFPAQPGPLEVESERRDRPHWWRARYSG